MTGRISCVTARSREETISGLASLKFRDLCLCLLSTRTKDMYHHGQTQLVYFPSDSHPEDLTAGISVLKI